MSSPGEKDWAKRVAERIAADRQDKEIRLATRAVWRREELEQQIEKHLAPLGNYWTGAAKVILSDSKGAVDSAKGCDFTKALGDIDTVYQQYGRLSQKLSLLQAEHVLTPKQVETIQDAAHGVIWDAVLQVTDAIGTCPCKNKAGSEDILTRIKEY